MSELEAGLSARRSRRQFLLLAGSTLAGLAAPWGTAWARAASSGDTAVAGYYTRPDLQPPTIAVGTASPTAAMGYVFISPFTGPGQHGPLIVDDAGEPVWFHPLPQLAWNFRVQTLRGKPVLTWWEGQPRTGTWQGQPVNGYLDGDCAIADTSYRVLKRLKTTFLTDPHDFVLTSRGTALLCGLNLVPTDLSSYGASASGTLLEGVVQEIDVATGKVLFTWQSADHVTPDESYLPVADAWDYFHINSVGVTQDGNLLVSARYPSAVYKLDRRSGAVLWRLGGKKSDFELGPGATFSFQHDARAHPGNLVSIFDDGADSPQTANEQTSRAIVLGLDTSSMRAQLVRAFPNPHGSLTTAMGNVQSLPDGGWFVGWGAVPEYSEFAPDGGLRFDASLVGGGVSYRAFRHSWTGRPTRHPDVAVSGNSDGTVDVYASWNGATEVSHWRFLGGGTADALAALRTVPRAGFETSVRLSRKPAYVAVAALDAHGTVLGTSRAIGT